MSTRKKKRLRRVKGTGSYRWVTARSIQLRYLGQQRCQKTERERGAEGADQEAKSLLDAFVERIDKNADVLTKGVRLTFNDLADLYLNAIDVAPTTREKYKRDLDNHMRPVIGNMRVQDLDSGHIRLVLSKAHDTSSRLKKRLELSGATRSNLLTRLRAILKFGEDDEYLARNVAKKVTMPKRDAAIERPEMTTETYKAILASANGTIWATIVPTAVGTGVRAGELCGLRWSDIDLDSGVLRVRRVVAIFENKPIVKAPKTKKSARTIYLPPSVVQVLERHRDAQLADIKMIVSELEAHRRQRSGYVFVDNLFRPYKPNELSRQFGRFVRGKKLPPFHFHGLRHAFATFALRAGVPLKTISDTMGHSGIAITANVYQHLIDEQREDAARALDAYLQRPPGRTNEAAKAGA